MNVSTSRTCCRISSIARVRYGSTRPSRKRSSPWSVQHTGRFSALRNGAASAISSEFGRLTTSGTGSSASHSSSLSNSLPQDAAVPLEHRNRQLAEHRRIRRERPRRERVDHPPRVPQPIEKARRAPEKRRVLLQVDADAAEQDALAADVRFVGIRRRVEREQRHLVAAAEQFDRERVVARAAAAVHPRGPGGDREDVHTSAVWNARARKRKSIRFPSCGCSQFNWIVGTGPRFRRSM